MGNRFFKKVPKRAEPSQAEVRRAKDFWTDIFEDSITAQLNDDSHGHAAASELVRFAGRDCRRGFKGNGTTVGKTMMIVADSQILCGTCGALLGLRSMSGFFKGDGLWRDALIVSNVGLPVAFYCNQECKRKAQV